jgi:hypothetical protein
MLMPRFLEIEERCTALLKGTYRTYGTDKIRPIGPMCPIKAFREGATECRASKTRAIAPVAFPATRLRDTIPGPGR